MAMLTGVEERKRRSRNIVFSAVVILVVLYTVKFYFPQHTILSSYSTYSNGLNPTDPSQIIVSIPSNTSPAKPKFTRINPNPVSSVEGSVAGDIVVAGDNFNGTIDNKAAVIIETRFRTNLIPLILHFSSVLGPSWPILIYTSAESVGLFASSAALSRYLQRGIIQIRILPQSVLFTNSDSVNDFMTQPWIWESLAPAEHILLFQSDSMLCANAARSVEDFFDYDFVGAPIAANLGHGYNGGLSLRKRSSVLKVLEEWNWQETKKEGDRFEDQWFYNRLVELQQRDEEADIEPEEDGAINLPSMEIARTFSVETIDYPHPLGVHQVHRWLKKQMVSLDEWCPEYKLCSSDYIVDS